MSESEAPLAEMFLGARQESVSASAPFEITPEEVEGNTNQRFERMTHLYPDQVSIRDGGAEMTYRQLNLSANRLAHAILGAGVEPPGPVAIMVGQNSGTVVALLAALKAGAAYVLLDPAWPQARLSYLLQDSRAALFLVGRETQAMAQGLAGGRCQVLDIESLDPTLLPSHDPELPVSPDDIAYITYTSGSSGEPKGVMLSHRARLNNTRNFGRCLGLRPGDRFAVVHAFSSGSSSGDIFAPLLTGGVLCVFDVRRRGFAELASWLVQERIAILHWLPTAIRHFLAALADDQAFPDLRVVISGSEPLSRADVDLMRARFGPGCLLMNRYGVTEGGNVAVYPIDQAKPIPGNVVPVGYELAGYRVAILNDAGQPVPEGDVGEIAIQSRYLASGYWRRPGLTRSRFHPDPNGGDERICLTGDLGRFLPGRCLVHLGRADSQVKVRGYRVELAEVEMALLGHPDVKEGAVIAQPEPGGDARLVGYIVANKDAKPTVGSLRRFLEERLPGHMIPSAFGFLPALPVNANGKVDRLALASLAPGRPTLDAAYLAPRDAMEASLTAIWSSVLGVDAAEIGVHDPFIELGGHSLHAAQILARVSDAFQVNLTPQQFFAWPTVAQQAAAIAQARSRSEPAKPRLVPRQRRSTGLKQED